MLTLIPGTDFYWARVIKPASLFRFGVNRNELTKLTARPNRPSRITAAHNLYSRAFFILSSNRFAHLSRSPDR